MKSEAYVNVQGRNYEGLNWGSDNGKERWENQKLMKKITYRPW